MIRRPSRTFLRYVALEAPGWVLSALLLSAVVEWGPLDPRWAVALWTLWVVKDFALYPWLKQAYEEGDPDATAALIGREGVAREPIAPRGYVRLGPELWRARLAPDSEPVEAGAAVRVCAVEGLTLVVEGL